MSHQLVTAVMITGKDPARVPLARAAIDAFKSQSWPNKQLVVINDGKHLGFELGIDDDPDIHEGLVRREGSANGPSCPLGELRNLGLTAADGGWVIQWDDDDWHHRSRIAYQMSGAATGYAVLLRNQIRYSFAQNTAYVMNWQYPANPGIPGTVLHPNTSGLRYREERTREDEHFLQEHFKQKCIVLENDEASGMLCCYIRFCHATNTWDDQHIMGKYHGEEHRNRWYLPRSAALYLRGVLQTHYGVADNLPFEVLAPI